MFIHTIKMSGWTKHIIFGIVFTALFYFLYNHYDVLTLEDLKFFMYIPLLIFVVQLPDLDHEKSMIRRLFETVSLLLIIGFAVLFLFTQNGLFLMLVIIIVTIFVLALYLRHRGIMHTVIAGLLLTFPLIFFSIMLFLVGFIGYLSHLVLDEHFSFI